MSEPRTPDHYEPKPPVKCPICGNPLGQWKGTDGPCKGLLWHENVAEPSLELLPKDDLATGYLTLRLDGDVHFHTTCAHCKDGALGIKAVGTVKNGVWTDTDIAEVVDKRSGNVIYSKYD
jgi:hypothetical protein